MSNYMGNKGDLYCDVYDAYYSKDGKWLESQCRDYSCGYCTSRPKEHPKDCKCKEK